MSCNRNQTHQKESSKNDAHYHKGQYAALLKIFSPIFIALHADECCERAEDNSLPGRLLVVFTHTQNLIGADGIVIQVRLQPLFHDFFARAFTLCKFAHLVFADFSDTKVFGLRV